MKALVTGSTGFLGQRLVRQLLDEGVDVRALMRDAGDASKLDAARETKGRLEVCEGRLGRLPPDLARGCDVVYHLAAEMGGGTATLFLANVVGTRGLIAAATDAHVGRFVLVSSLAVYGTGRLRAGDVLDERCAVDSEPHRRDPYSYSKIAQEEVAWDAQRRAGLPLAVVRPGVIYGPGHEAITSRVGLRLGDFVLQMSGRDPLPYTFVDNCARAVLLAGTVPAAAGQAFNVIDDELPTGREILRAHRHGVGKLRVLTVPSLAIGPLSGLCEWYHEASRGQLPAVLTRYKSEAHWKRLRYDNAKAKSVLGWRPEVGLAQGLRRTLAWLRTDRDARRAGACLAPTA